MSLLLDLFSPNRLPEYEKELLLALKALLAFVFD